MPKLTPDEKILLDEINSEEFENRAVESLHRWRVQEHYFEAMKEIKSEIERAVLDELGKTIEKMGLSPTDITPEVQELIDETVDYLMDSIDQM